MLLLAACSQQSSQGPTPTTVAAPIFELTSITAAAMRAVPAEIQTKGRMELASKVTGVVRHVLVTEGQRVATGQRLLIIDDADLAARAQAQRHAVQQAEAQADSARVRAERAEQNLVRLQRVFGQGAVARDDVDQAHAQATALAREAEALRAQVQSLQAALQEIEAIRSSAVVTAPAAGVLTRRLVDAGAFVRAGEPLAIVESEEAGLELVAEVDETWLGRLAIGTPLAASVPALSPEPRPVHVTAVIPAVASTRFRIKTSPPEGLVVRSGMFARLLLPQSPQPRLLLPAAGLHWRGGLPIAWVVDAAHTVRLRLLRLGTWFFLHNGTLLPAPPEAPGAAVEVLAGLSAGERVLLDAPPTTREGQRWRAP